VLGCKGSVGLDERFVTDRPLLACRLWAVEEVKVPDPQDQTPKPHWLRRSAVVDGTASVIPLPDRAGRDRRMSVEPDLVTLTADQGHRLIADAVSTTPMTTFVNPFVHDTTSFREPDGRMVAARYSVTGLAVCSCGSNWWRLSDGPNGEPGAIVLAPDLSVTGWTGTPVCVECDQSIEISK
jgi:hypothetical protein